MALGGGVDLPTIKQRIVVDDSALSGLGARLGSIGATLGKAVAAGAAVAAAGVGAFVASGVRGAIDVEKGIAEVVTLFGKTGDEAKALGSSLSAGVAGLSNDVGIAQDVLVNGLYSAISAGVPEENAFEFMKVASKAAIAGVTDVETAVDGISTTINAFGLEASDAREVSDSMFAAVQGGKTTFEELSNSLANVAPAAAASKVSFQEVNAAIATLTAGGTGTAEATTQLRAALVGLQRPSKEMDEIFQALGYDSAQVAIESEGLGFALNAVSDAAGGNNGKLQQLLGSSEAVAAAQVIAGTGAEKFNAELERQAKASEGAGEAAKAFETMNQTTSRAMENLKVQFQNAAIAVGAEFLPKINEVVTAAAEHLPAAIATVRGVIEGLIEVFRTIAEVVGEVVAWVQEHWDALATTAQVAGTIIAVAFGPHLIAKLALAGATAVVNAALMAGAWVSTQVAAIKAAVIHSAQVLAMVGRWVFLGAQSLLAAARVAAAWLLSIAPIAIVIAAVVGLVYLIVKYWDEIKAAIAAGWEWVKRVTSDLWNGITRFLSDKWAEIRREVGVAVDTVKRVVSDAWTAIKTKTSEAIGAVVTFFAELPGRVVSALANLGSSIVGVAVAAWQAWDNAVDTAVGVGLEFVRGIPGKIVDALGDVGSLLYNKGKEIVQGLIDGIKAMVGKVGDAIGSVTRRISRFLPGSPVAEGPLTILNRGYAGKQIGRMLAGGLEDTTSSVAAAASRVASAAAGRLAGAPLGAAAGGALASSSAAYTFHGDIVLPNVTDRSTADDLLAGLRQAVRQGAR